MSYRNVWWKQRSGSGSSSTRRPAGERMSPNSSPETASVPHPGLTQRLEPLLRLLSLGGWESNMPTPGIFLPTRPDRRKPRLLVSAREAQQQNRGPSCQQRFPPSCSRTVARSYISSISESLPRTHPGTKGAKELGITGLPMRKDSRPITGPCHENQAPSSPRRRQE